MTTVLLVNLGTPRAPTADAVRSFLAEFLSDPLVVDYPRWLWRPLLHGVILRRRPEAVAELYRAIWAPGGSPLAVGTAEIARALDGQLPEDVTVQVAYRYSPSSLQEALQQRDDPARPRLVVPLFPQRTGSSSGTIRRLVQSQAGSPARCLALPPDHPGYLEALAGRCRETLRDVKAGLHLVVSFHGIPVRHDRREQGQYTRDCQATFRGLLQRLDWDPQHATLTFQSKFGPDRWLTPATAAVLAELPRRGVTRVAVITPGFLTEGLETLEEIGIRGRDSFLEAGGEEFVRVPAVQDHPALIAALRDLVLAGIAEKSPP